MSHCEPLPDRMPAVSQMTLEEAIGQTLCFGWSGPDAACVNAHAAALVEEIGVGGVALLGRNVSDPASTKAMLSDLQALSSVPLLVAIDHEGGMVCRFNVGLHSFPGAMALGAIGDADRAASLARQQANAQARELRALGINWNLSPSVDVNNNPGNPIIGVRSFGHDPAAVGILGAAVVEGLQSEGVLACAKHFPGHGDTSVDSHLGLPAVSSDWPRLQSVELPPFRATIDAGVHSIMTTHIVFAALDRARPATLSQAILTGLLREQLGFRGLIVTDCLEMAAISETVGTPRAAVEALLAGADMVLVCHTLDVQRETVRAIRQAVESQTLPESRVREAAERVVDAKRRLASRPAIDDPEPWLDPDHDALEEEIARASVTVVRATSALPIPAAANVCVSSFHHAAETAADELNRLGANARAVALTDETATGLSGLEVAAMIAGADRIVVLTAPREPWSDRPIDQDRQAALVRRLHADAGDRLIVVAIREPYDIRRFPQVLNYICTYGYRPCSLRALAAALMGRFAPSGKLPVSLPLD